jgi:hypothetical protein
MGKLLTDEKIRDKIYQVRGKKVMLDEDLAELYGVQTKVLIQAVKRNIKRFPDDFMRHLRWKELMSLRSQFVTSKMPGRGGRRYCPYAFTEQGIAMLSTVLNSERAIKVNIQIMRAFVALRRWVITYEGLRRKIEDMEKKYDGNFQVVFTALRELMAAPPNLHYNYHLLGICSVSSRESISSLYMASSFPAFSRVLMMDRCHFLGSDMNNARILSASTITEVQMACSRSFRPLSNFLRREAIMSL